MHTHITHIARVIAQKLAQVTQKTTQQVQSLEPAIETTHTALRATAGAAVSFSATVDVIEARAQHFAKSVEAFRLFVSQCEEGKQGAGQENAPSLKP